MARRRSPKVVWLPQDNLSSVGPVPDAGTAVYQTFAVDVIGGVGSFAVGEIPLVIDGPQDPLLITTSLSDIANSGYRLRRIVGKIWVRVAQAANDGPATVVVTAAIIVRRVNEAGASLAFLTGNASTLSPGEIQNTEDPWVWRRSWYLCNTLSQAAAAGALTGLPTDNVGLRAGSALDGPHIDQKTARIIGPEERLFLTVSSTVINEGGDQVALSSVILTDLRVLGTLRTTSGNRRNASR